MAAIWIVGNGRQQLPNLALRVGMLEDWQTKRSFGDKQITLYQLKALRSAISVGLIIAGYNCPLSAIFETNLRTTKDVASWV